MEMEEQLEGSSEDLLIDELEDVMEMDDDFSCRGSDSFSDNDNGGWWVKVKAIFKLLIIIICYSAAFVSMAQIGFLLVSIPVFNEIIIPTDVITWMSEKWRHAVWWDSAVKSLVLDFGLLLAFGLQHSLMTQKFLEDTWIWTKLHYVYKFDRPVYVLCTALVLQGIIHKWEVVPVTVWALPWFEGYHTYTHIFGWIFLYGTSLMFDLPEMVGFNQVVISSPNMTMKSPELQLILRTQRHMGLLAFTIILLAQPYMYLDRFIMATLTIGYMYFSWRSPFGYEYTCRMKNLKSEVLR